MTTTNELCNVLADALGIGRSLVKAHASACAKPIKAEINHLKDDLRRYRDESGVHPNLRREAAR